MFKKSTSDVIFGALTLAIWIVNVIGAAVTGSVSLKQYYCAAIGAMIFPVFLILRAIADDSEE